MEKEYECTDIQKLRKVMMEELETINQYEQMRDNTKDKDIKKMLDYIIEEEEEHFNMAQNMLDKKEKDEEDSEGGAEN